MICDKFHLKVVTQSSVVHLYVQSQVELATLAYKIFHDCTPPSMGHILNQEDFSYPSFTHYEHGNSASF